MKNLNIPQNLVKYVIGLLTVIGLRLLPHPPNVEPIMSTMMPFSKKWGWLSGMFFCLAAILIFDLLTGTLGTWSLITAGTYAALGALAGVFFKTRKSNIANYVGFAIVATIIYDAITGIGMGMLLFDMPFITTLTGQIPFTLYHLGGNIVLSAVVSPILYKWVITNPRLETQNLIRRFSYGVK